MNEVVRLLLVDDHKVVREGLHLFLEPNPNLEIVGEASNGQEALEQAETLQPNVIIMDLLMPVMDGVTAIREIKKAYPNIEIVALTSFLEDQLVVEAIQAGAMGYLLKDTDSEALIEAIFAAYRVRCDSIPRLPNDLCARCELKIRANRNYLRHVKQISLN